MELGEAVAPVDSTPTEVEKEHDSGDGVSVQSSTSPVTSPQAAEPSASTAKEKKAKKPAKGDGADKGKTKERQRNLRACDNCSARRTKCDGKHPCAPCSRRLVKCLYDRAVKKRGRIPLRLSAQQHARPEEVPGATPRTTISDHAEKASPNGTMTGQVPPSVSGVSSTHMSNVNLPQFPGYPGYGSPGNQMGPNALPGVHEITSPMSLQNGADSFNFGLSGGPYPSNNTYHGSTARLPFIHHPNPSIPQPLDHDLLARPPTGMSGFMSTLQDSNYSDLRYPVLKPLLPYISKFLSRPMACDLLDAYFKSAFRTVMHPICPYIHAYVFRKSSFLCRTSPRPCKPALLASMLWVAARQNNIDLVPLHPSENIKLCQNLSALAIRLLAPLVHRRGGISETEIGDLNKDPSFELFNDRLPYPGESDLVCFPGCLDDVITYMHIGSIVSASESKAASMRWWHIAWTLARELKLNQEVGIPIDFHRHMTELFDPILSQMDHTNDSEVLQEVTGGFDNVRRESVAGLSPDWWASEPLLQRTVTEEQKEERRRTWWLLYLMDRHLALCYNQPLALMDAECMDLMLPIDESLWQNDEPYGQWSPDPTKERPATFPSFECTGHTIFGFFLPLMTILGEIIDLNHVRVHPCFGKLTDTVGEHLRAGEISAQLTRYEESLEAFRLRELSKSAAANGTSPQALNELMGRRADLQTEIVIAYATHIKHVLHILVSGKLDPVSLFDDEDSWISSPSFLSATQHAVSAASALETVVELDPEMSFIPYFMGIQLLQGSFLLLLVLDNLQGSVGPEIIHACEVIVRATEACIVTLDTEYQRNIRKLFRSALAEARNPRMDPEEKQARRRAVLALYRWTRNGTGLAL